MRRICVKCSLFDIDPTSEDDLFGMLIRSDGNRPFTVQLDKKGPNKGGARRTESLFGIKGEKTRV